MNYGVCDTMTISSDSDEGSYDNIAQKLQKLKDKSLLRCDIETALSSKNSDDVIEITGYSSKNSDDVIDITGYSSTLNNKHSEPNNYESSDLFLKEPVVLKKSRSKRKKSASDSDYEVSPKSNRRGRGRSKSRIKTKSKDRGKGKSKGSSSASVSGNCESISSSPINSQPSSSSRRGGRRRGTLRRSSRIPNRSIPTYNIGNTDEYPDELENQKLFVQKPQEIPVIDLDSSLLNKSLNNEVLSVKVYWQSLEVVKFNIRRLQKLTEIFDHFMNQEGVSKDNLLFTYNDNILKPDDTPESIEYCTTKFIEGGVTSEKVSLTQNKTEQEKSNPGGFKVKFQCQSKKKPYEVTIGKDDRFQEVMVRCAEHLELPIAKLRFEFDGDVVLRNMTPASLDMETGDCIDVKLLS